MLITVTRVLEEPGSSAGPLVEFRCAAGRATARWAGAVRPGLGDHDVELDVPETVSVFDRGEPGLDRVEGVLGAPGGSLPAGVRLCGRVEEVGVGEDPIVVLRVGGGLLMTETDGPRPLPGAWVRLTVTELVLCPTGI
ncbi:hypothetical protein [Nocardiopsis ganjiahuensis]|uniref:hypothetical protein n=1 Tax=Nocardiopsis ganjiahuensis TaxID=239984 RepID=UPI000345FF5B|nr:hypothetical protein [Nocardiopsis ganjiahuensis]